MYVCLWSPDWSIAGASECPADVAPLLADLAPRLRIEREVVWADGRGLDARRLAERLVARLAELGVEARAGVSAVPITTELAARTGGPTAEDAPARDGDTATPFLVKDRTGWGWRRDSSPGGGPDGEKDPDRVAVVPPGAERAWLAHLPVAVLEPEDRLRTLMEGVGIASLGTLAGLEREAVEVRLGAAAVTLWRLARADDRRLLFERIPPERPHGSIDFVDYVLTDPSRLLFTANALLGPLCDGLRGRGEHARALRLTLPLANGDAWTRTIRPARPTASRDRWLRLVRGLLDRLTVPDAVAGMRIEVLATEEAAVRQGDLFDRGFATAAAVEAAVARLAERQLLPLTPETTAHPLIERQGRWAATRRTRSGGEGAGDGASKDPHGEREASSAGLTLRLLEPPRRIAVETSTRRDHALPVRIHDGDNRGEVSIAAGPDRISGGQWETASYAREYYRCVTAKGRLVWIFRDGLDGGWYLHGWWD